MSNQTNEQKVYVPKSSAREITFQQSGKTIIKLGFHVETMIDFLKQHANEKGYINLGISKRREPSEQGSTHCVWLDTWQPKPTSERPQRMSREQVSQGLAPAKHSEPKEPTETDDVPF